MTKAKQVTSSRAFRQFLLIEALSVGAFFVALFLLSIVPRFAGYSAFVVYGGSMEPAIQKGSVAVGRPMEVDSLKTGDVIAYRKQAGTPTIHRIVDVSETNGRRTFLTKGDANDEPDPKLLVAEGRGAKIVYAVPLVGYALNAPTMLHPRLLLGLPAAGLALILLWSIWLPDNHKGQSANKELRALAPSQSRHRELWRGLPGQETKTT